MVLTTKIFFHLPSSLRLLSPLHLPVLPFSFPPAVAFAAGWGEAPAAHTSVALQVHHPPPSSSLARTASTTEASCSATRPKQCRFPFPRSSLLPARPLLSADFWIMVPYRNVRQLLRSLCTSLTHRHQKPRRRLQQQWWKWLP